MQAKPRDTQGELYSVRLDFLCDESQPLFRLSKVIDWSQFDQAFGRLCSEDFLIFSFSVAIQNPFSTDRLKK